MKGFLMISKRSILVPAIVLFACWGIAVFSLAPGIEASLAEKTNQSLEKNGFDGVRAVFDGRDVVLRGYVSDLKRQKRILQIVQQVEGVLSVDDQTKLFPVIVKTIVRKTEQEPKKKLKKMVIVKPASARSRTRMLGLIKSQSVFFHRGTSIIKTSSFRAMLRVAAALRKNPKSKIEIRGHADSIGSKRKNLRLARGRALSVLNGLVELGVKKKQLKIKFFGESAPRATNENHLGRSENRRVEFKLIRG